MAKGTEIKVDLVKLQNDIAKMNTLKTETANYVTSVSFEKSKGKSIDNFIAIYDQILGLQKDLIDLYSNTAKTLKKAKLSFKNEDGKAAEYFRELGDS